MATLTRAAIEKAAELRTKLVPVPEWGGDAMLRELTGTQRDAYEASIVDSKTVRRGKETTQGYNLYNIRARLVSLCLVDPETMQPMYDEREIGVLGNKSAAVLDRLFSECQKLSGITDEDFADMTKELDDPKATQHSGTPSVSNSDTKA
jgi:hypothetical protein